MCKLPLTFIADPDAARRALAGRRRAALALAALAAMLLAACATPQVDALHARAQPQQALGISAARRLEQVPFYAQQRAQCGPATLAMALSSAGMATDPDALGPEVFVPGRGGSLAPEMLAAARRRGALAVQLAPDIGAVLREVDAGNPVIVLQNLGLAVFPVWHYALLIGYDLDRDRVLLHSGPDPQLQMSLELFERTWARGGYWAMVAVAPQSPPRSASIEALVEAAAALERVDSAGARKAYLALTERAPQNFGAWIGLGNSAFAQGEAAAAVVAFGRAADLQPGNADAWNNLATALLEQGSLAQAQAAIERARALGGAHRDQYEQTAAQIERAQAGR